MQNLKQPLFIATASAIAITMLGAGLGWFSIENEIVRSLAESELGKKESLAIALSAGTLGATILASKTKFRLAFIATIVSIYELIMIINQKPEDAIATQIGVTTEIGYWLSIAGTLAVIVTSVIIGIKGFGSKKEN
jgi:hypothetical protein